MRKICVSLSIFFLLGASFYAEAETAKIKFFESVYLAADGLKLKYPESVACRGDSLLVADTGNSRILRYSYQNRTLTPEGQYPLNKAYPIVIQVNSQGEIYYLDGKERRIGRLSATGEAKGPMKFSGLPGSKELILRSFKIDEKDNIYLLDIFAEMVFVVDAEGKFLHNIPFPEGYGFFSDLAIDQRGNVFLLDSVNAAIYAQHGPDTGFVRLTKGLKEYINFPTGIATDRSGQIYLTDQFGSGLVVIGRDGSFLGRKIAMGWIDGMLFYPSQLCLSNNDEIFIADRSNSRIQIFGLVEK